MEVDVFASIDTSGNLSPEELQAAVQRGFAERWRGVEEGEGGTAGAPSTPSSTPASVSATASAPPSPSFSPSTAVEQVMFTRLTQVRGQPLVKDFLASRLIGNARVMREGPRDPLVTLTLVEGQKGEDVRIKTSRAHGASSKVAKCVCGAGVNGDAAFCLSMHVYLRCVCSVCVCVCAGGGGVCVHASRGTCSPALALRQAVHSPVALFHL